MILETFISLKAPAEAAAEPDSSGDDPSPAAAEPDSEEGAKEEGGGGGDAEAEDEDAAAAPDAEEKEEVDTSESLVKAGITDGRRASTVQAQYCGGFKSNVCAII